MLGQHHFSSLSPLLFFSHISTSSRRCFGVRSNPKRVICFDNSTNTRRLRPVPLRSFCTFSPETMHKMRWPHRWSAVILVPCLKRLSCKIHCCRSPANNLFLKNGGWVFQANSRLPFVWTINQSVPCNLPRHAYSASSALTEHHRGRYQNRHHWNRAGARGKALFIMKPHRGHIQMCIIVRHFFSIIRTVRLSQYSMCFDVLWSIFLCSMLILPQLIFC